MFSRNLVRFLPLFVLGGSYLSQSDLRMHFGLGDATKVDSVEIRWPSDEVDTIKSLDVDRFYRVLEGKGVVPAEQIRRTSYR